VTSVSAIGERVGLPVSEASLFHVPDAPFAYGIGPRALRVVVRCPRGAVRGGHVAYNDRYAWQDDDYAPLVESAPLHRYAADGGIEYWAAELRIDREVVARVVAMVRG
jgi:hypothetical protein